MRLALVILLTTLIATCGQKGPLRLPAPEARAPLAAIEAAIEAAAEATKQVIERSGTQT